VSEPSQCEICGCSPIQFMFPGLEPDLTSLEDGTVVCNFCKHLIEGDEDDAEEE
jgi:hypothetical protein